MPRAYGRSAKGVYRRRWRQPPRAKWVGTVAVVVAAGQPILVRSVQVPHMALGQTALRRRY